MRSLVLLFTTMLLATSTVAAQVVGQNAQPGGSSGAFTMSVSTNLVIEPINVKDKQGKPLKGLTAKDFTITENGVPQQISFCDYQELPTPPATPAAKPPPENITVYNRLSVTHTAPETPGTVRYKD